jgi:hypothetical protein
MSEQKSPLETAMDIMRLAKLPPGYEPAILPVGFIDAVRELVKTDGELPVERGEGPNGYTPRAIAQWNAWQRTRRALGDYDLLRCLAPSEWARTKSCLDEIREVIEGKA